jgi:hypothetical protein
VARRLLAARGNFDEHIAETAKYRCQGRNESRPV